MTLEEILANPKKTSEYRSWRFLLKSCLDKKSTVYRGVGAKGVNIEPEWRTNFESFIRHIGPKENEKHIVLRYDHHRGFYPGNVYWGDAQTGLDGRIFTAVLKPVPKKKTKREAFFDIDDEAIKNLDFIINDDPRGITRSNLL